MLAWKRTVTDEQRTMYKRVEEGRRGRAAATQKRGFGVTQGSLVMAFPGTFGM